MNRSTFRTLLMFISLGLMTGCASHYDVTVNNHVSDEVTIWLTKLAPPYDHGLLPPEEVAVGTTDSQRLGGVVIKPGESARAILDTHANPANPVILRVYRATDLNDILAISQGNPKRLDIPINAGVTDIDLVIENGEFTTESHVKPPPK